MTPPPLPRRRTLVRWSVGAALGLLLVAPARASFAPGHADAATDALGRPTGVPGYTAVVDLGLQQSGRDRSYLLHVPDGLLGPAPLVVALHGANQTAAQMRDYTRLTALSDAEGFVLAFGSGVDGSWNAGECCRPKANDVAYLDALVDHATDPVRSRTVVDPDRVFFTGFSNGGMMALRYACERSDRVAAVAVVSSVVVAEPCGPREQVAVLDLHGELDRVVPLAGGRNTTFDVTFPAVRDSLQPFRRTGEDVRVRVVAGVGHGWMRPDAPAGAAPADGPHEALDASRAVWDWLRDHPRR